MHGPVLLPPGIYGSCSSASTQPAVEAGPVYGITQMSPSAPAAGPSGSNQKEHAFPQRPGQPECQYYIYGNWGL